MIDLKQEPIDNFVTLLSSKNPSLPPLTSQDIAIRRLGLNTPEKWGGSRVLSSIAFDGYGSKPYIVPEHGWPKDNAGFLVHRKITFKGGDVTFITRADNNFRVWVAGTVIYSGSDYTANLSHTANIPAGEHDVYYWSWNGTGGAGLAGVINDAGTHHNIDSTNWTCIDIGGDDPVHWVEPNGESTVEVDLLIEPSEAVGDYVEFSYERITMQNLFGGIDYDANAAGVQIPYHIDDIDMILGSVDNFKSIYNNWYRFSHSTSLTYPANASELDKWVYIDEYDCVECNFNSGTYIGFISDDLYDDYEFNTVITAENGDDDAITCVLAAFKQGDIDAHEHTLDLVLTRGGLNGSYIRLNSNFARADNKYVRIIDPDTTPPNSGNPWTPWYGHVIAKRVGSLLTIWSRQEQLPTPDAGQSRDDMISVLVSDLARWEEKDFIENNYFKTVVDLSVEETKFNRSVRFGYGAWSQGAARYWNIRRPGDNPNVTPKLKTYLTDRYGVNVGTDGVTVENLGANEFKLGLDNILYHGDLELTPTNRRYILGAESLLTEGTRFSHDATDTYPAVPGELNAWQLKDDNVYFAGGGSFSGVVTPYLATEYEFHTDVSSEGAQHYPVAIVVAFVESGGREHTLSVLCDVPEGVGGGEWSVRYNTLQSDAWAMDSNGQHDDVYYWSQISTRNVYVKRVGNIIEVSCNNKHDEPGTDWVTTIDLASDPRLAPFIAGSKFGYGCYTQSMSTFSDKIV